VTNLKLVHQLEIQGKYDEALQEYKNLSIKNPALKKIYDRNIDRLKKKLLKFPLPSVEKIKESINSKPFVGVKSEVKPLKGSHKYIYDSDLDRFSSWSIEFGPGEFFVDQENKKVNIKSDGNRFYISRKFNALAGYRYVIDIEFENWAGGIGNIFALVNFKHIEGDREILAKKIPSNGHIKMSFTAPENTDGSMRLGIGTTASVNGLCSMTVKRFTVREMISPKTNSKLISSFAKEYIDPELILPDLIGEGNDYSFIETKANQLLNMKAWEKQKLSVVISGYERANLLRNTLACLIHQTYPKCLIEVIIVDDGSVVDNYEQIFDEFSKDLTLYLVRQKNNGYGLSRARNLGARSARGDVLFFLDSDILLPKDFLRQLMAYHHVSNDCSILGLRYFVDAEKINLKNLREGSDSPDRLPRCNSENPHLKASVDNTGYTVDWRISEFKKNDWLKNAENPFRFFGGGHSSVSRERFFKVGGYDEDFKNWGNEDQEFAYRLWCIGQYFVPLKDTFDYHQEEPSKKLDQSFKLKENEKTHLQLIDRCPNFTVRQINKKNEGFLVPLFSIYIPAYNVENYIEECVESVLNQTYKDFEVVVVNDGSTDSTWERLQKYKFNTKIKLINKANGGIGSASNFAIKHAKGEYVVQLDSDDILYPNALESLVEYFKTHPYSDCVYTNHIVINEKSEQIGEGWSPPKFDRYENLIGMNVPHMRAFRRSIYFRTVGFDETLVNAVDYDYFLKISTVAKIDYLPKALYKYRVHKSQTSSAKSSIQISNHELVVTQYLRNIGMDDFYAKPFNPFMPRHNFIVRRDSDFESELSHRVFNQPPVPELVLPKPFCPGNNYTAIQDFVKNYYKNNIKNYSEKVSIIVPVYNRSERLGRCLAGICKQSYPLELIEVVVVDDGSSDAVLNVVNKYNKLIDLKYLKQHDSGYRLSAARNLGIRAASHRNISIIDCDLIPLPVFIESFMQYLHHYDNVVLLGHQRFVDPTGISDDDILRDINVLKKMKDIKSENSTMEDTPDGITKDWRYKLYEETDYLKKDEYVYRAFSSGHVAYRRKVIEEAGFYDEEFNVWGCEDNEAGYRIYQRGYYFIPVLEAVDLHQEPPSGKNETNREADRIISRDMLESKLPAMRGWFGKPYQVKFSDVPLVSVCVPVHNTGDFAVQAVQSVLNQTLKDLEVVIYDDASTDDTLSKLKTSFISDPRVRIIEGLVHKNVTYARNLLINSARGEFIGFLDSDDLLKHNCLELCIKEFRAAPNVGLICTGYEKINEDGGSIGPGWSPAAFDREGLIFGNIFTHFRMFRVRDWHRSRKWNEWEISNYFYGEDWDLCLKLAEVTDFSRITNSLYEYRVRDNSITNSNNFEFKFNQTKLMIQNWLKILNFNNLKIIQRDKSNPSSVGYY
jgi:glycosyltransferase involved in cell wall biosynthesis